MELCGAAAAADGVGLGAAALGPHAIEPRVLLGILAEGAVAGHGVRPPVDLDAEARLLVPARRSALGRWPLMVGGRREVSHHAGLGRVSSDAQSGVYGAAASAALRVE